MPKPIFVATFGEIIRPKHQIILNFQDHSQRLLNEYSKKFAADEKLKVTISHLTQKKIRSLEQNNYYWGVVLAILARYFGYIGPGEKEDLHNELRSIFLVRIGRLGSPVVESTTKLSTDIFERYLEAIRSWALAKYEIKIPLPNESTESDTYRRI